MLTDLTALADATETDALGSLTFVPLSSGERPNDRSLLDLLAKGANEGDQLASLRAGRAPRFRVLRKGAGFCPLPDDQTLSSERALVFLDESCVLSSRSLVSIRHALATVDPHIPAAFALRTNWAEGDELLVGVPYRPHEREAIELVLSTWHEAHPDAVSPAASLLGPCLVLSPAAVVLLGGEGILEESFDPGGWCRAIREAGGEIGVIEGAYLHHPGGTPIWPDPRDSNDVLISACLIVRDEVDNLPRCLESMEGIADEVIVYDTGSVDSTRELAASLGTRVIEGYWDDDFARARNDALRHCKGAWILWLDADEALSAPNASLLREHLRTARSALEGYVVLIDNLRGTTTSNVLTHPAVRLFRRACGRWYGRLHEQIFAAAGSKDLTLVVNDECRITHWGYLQDAMRNKEKGERNLRTAFADLAGGSGIEPALRLCNLGRSYLMAGRQVEGIEFCKEAASRAQLPATRRLSLRGAIEGLLGAGRYDEALELVGELRAASKVQSLADVLEGHIRLALGELEKAASLFSSIQAGIDDDAFEYGPNFVAAPLAETLFRMAYYDSTVRVLLDAMRSGGGIDAHLGLLIDAMEHAGLPLAGLHQMISAERVVDFLPQILQLQVDVADRVLEAWIELTPDSKPLLAAAARIAPRLGVERQLTWSARLRTVGLAFACPLVSAGVERTSDLRDRLLSLAAATVAFNDPRATQLLVALLAERDRAIELNEELKAFGPTIASLLDAVPVIASRHHRTDLEPDKRNVLIVDASPGRLRTTGLAAELVRQGHTVTLLHPQPTASSERLLAGTGAAVHGWPDAGDDADAQARAQERLVAHLSADHTYDVAIVPVANRSTLPSLRRLLPLAYLAVDLDNALLPDALGPAELLLSSITRAPSRIVASTVAAAGATSVLTPRAALPWSIRRGVCVVVSLRHLDKPSRESLCGRIVQTLSELGDVDVPLMLIGDDPYQELAKALPNASALGAVADPLPYLEASRVALLATGEDAEHWIDAAAMATTPIVQLDGSGNVALTASLLHAALDAEVPTTVPVVSQRLLGADPLASLGINRRNQKRSAAASSVVRLVGDVSSLASLAGVNRALLRALAKSCPELTLTIHEQPPAGPPAANLNPLGLLSSDDPRRLPAPAIEIRHQWPPDFSPASGDALVLIQPWEFGGLPAEWVGPIRDVVDDLWVPSSWELRCAIASGVDPARVHVVANGVDVKRFCPDGPTYSLRTTKSTKLLFVGGLIERKGVDVLLETYLTAFGPDDDVCLVIKPFGSTSVYRNSDLEPAVRHAATGDGAEIEILEEALDESELAALYRSCDALVHPYRGEGFGMPIAEAMACGLPVIVPNGGACLDFCDKDVAWLIEAPEIPLNLGEFTPSKAGTWWLEPDRSDLIKTLRAVVANPRARAAKGEAARKRIVEQFTWEHTADAATARLRALMTELRDKESITS